MIQDPATRLTPEYIAKVTARYATAPVPVDGFDDRYAAACDLAVQLLWPEKYGTDPADPHWHTSDPARRIASLFCAALGVLPVES
jgi:hypothetical protein